MERRSLCRCSDEVVPAWSGAALAFRAGDSNLFRYVGNSPPNGTDPSGLAAPPRPPSRIAESWVDILKMGNLQPFEQNAIEGGLSRLLTSLQFKNTPRLSPFETGVLLRLGAVYFEQSGRRRLQPGEPRLPQSVIALMRHANADGIAAYLKKPANLKQLAKPTAKIKDLIAKLGDEDFGTRQDTEKKLLAEGKTQDILPSLYDAHWDTSDFEIRNRAERIMGKVVEQRKAKGALAMTEYEEYLFRSVINTRPDRKAIYQKISQGGSEYEVTNAARRLAAGKEFVRRMGSVFNPQ